MTGDAKIRTFIVDDEPLAIRGLRRQLEAIPEVELVGYRGDSYAAVEAIHELEPELLLLDIEMPGLDGFGLLQAIDPQIVPVTIFITAHNEHALRAFQVHALDYLLKPVDDAALRAAVQRAVRLLRPELQQDFRARLADLLADHERATAAPSERVPFLQRLLIREGRRAFFVKLNEIETFEAQDNYVRLSTKGGRTHLVRSTMTELEKRLDPAHFVRIHRSAIVRLEAIAEIRPDPSGDHIVLLVDGRRLRLSRSYRDRVMENALFGL